KAFWQQRDLVSVHAFDESLHGSPRWKRAVSFYFCSEEGGSVFTQPRPFAPTACAAKSATSRLSQHHLKSDQRGMLSLSRYRLDVSRPHGDVAAK
ncbi:MAG TPA: hypothetical protein VF555_02130, partial [Variovorax sp.]